MGLGPGPRDSGQDGLAVLLSRSPQRRQRVNALATKLLPTDLEASLRFVFDADAEVSVVLPAEGDGGGQRPDYASIARHLADVAAGLTSSGASGAPSGAHVVVQPAVAGAAAEEPAAGRLGPPHVVVSDVRGSVAIEDGASAEGRSAFSTCRANVCVFKGRWMYEVVLGTAGIIQLGWTTLTARYTPEEGVGDSNDSYAYDGKRRRKWNVSAAPYGEAWTAGDVIGCCIDMDAGRISFTRNGVDQGVAFDYVRRRLPGAAYFPGASLSAGERCEFNFGARPFLYPVEGFAPLEAPPSPARLRAASYMSACLLRLVEVTAPAGAQQAQQRAQHAQQQQQPAGGHEGCSSSEEGGEEEGELASSGGYESDTEGYSSGSMGRRGAPGMGAAAGVRTAAEAVPDPGHSAPVISWALPRGGLGGAGLLLDEEGAGGKPPSAAALLLGGRRGGNAIGVDEAVLLASLLAPHLGPWCCQQYTVCTALLPMLRGALDAGRPSLLRLLGLLEVVLEEGELQAMQRTLVLELARRVRTCCWCRAELPGSAALDALQLWEGLLGHDGWRRRWLGWRDWPAELEGLLTQRQPTSGDLAGVFPGVRFSEGGGQQRAQFAEDLAALEEALGKVEEAQVGILLALWRTSGPLEFAHPMRGVTPPWGGLCVTPPAAETGAAAGEAAAEAAEAAAAAAAGSTGEEVAAEAAARPSSPDVCAPGASTAGAGPSTEAQAAAGEAVGPSAAAAPQEGAAAPAEPAPRQGSSPEEGPAVPAAVEPSTAAAAAHPPRPRYDPLGIGRSRAAGAAPAPEAAPAPAAAAAGPVVAPVGTRLPAVAGASQAALGLAHGPLGSPRATYDPLGLRPPEVVVAEGDAVRWFVAWLVRKNRGARRDMPPPGLSDSSVLTSLFYCLLRLLRPTMLDTCHIQGEGFGFAGGILLRGLSREPDPYDDLQRLGGTLSHLSKAHAPSALDAAAAAALRVPAAPPRSGWLGPMPEVPPVAELAAGVDTWLLDRMLVLHHLGVALQLRAAFGHLQTIDNAAVAVQEISARLRTLEAPQRSAASAEPAPPASGTQVVEEAWDAATAAEGTAGAGPSAAAAAPPAAAGQRAGGTGHGAGAPRAAGTAAGAGGRGGLAGAGGGESEEVGLLRHSLAEQQQRIVEAVRHHGWHQAWLLAGWKQESTLALSALVCRLLGALGAASDTLFRYVPELYLEATLDMMHAVHRAEPCVATAPGLLEAGVDACLDFLIPHLADARIANPDVRSMPVQTVWVLLQEEDWLGVLPELPACREHLLPGLLRLFAQERYWVQVGNVLLLLVEGTGFMQPPAQRSEQWRGGVRALRRLLRDACESDPSLAASFLNHLFSSASWAATEMVVAVEEMNNAWPSGGSGTAVNPQATHALRRAGVTAELLASLLRLLEFVAGLLPALFLAGPPLNLTRVTEVAGFALAQLTAGGRAVAGFGRLETAVGELLGRNRLALSGGEFTNRRDLLRPLAGLLVNLWAAESGQLPAPLSAAADAAPSGTSSGAGEEGDAAGPSLLAAGAAGTAGTAAAQVVQHSLVAALAKAAGVGDAQLDALAASDWGLPGGGPAQPAHLQQARLLDELVAAIKAKRAELAESAAARSGAGEPHVEIPNEFLDPILMHLMTDPVVLPDSKVTLDRSTIERHLLSSATDPFSRAPLEAGQLQPDTQLAAAIFQWLEEHPEAAASPH